MSKSLLLAVCLLLSLLVFACSRSQDTNRNAAVTISGDPIGVPECDNFLNAYESCLSTKVPEAARANLRTVMTKWRTDWKKLADNPQTKPGLVEACKAQHETARTQMKAYGCTF